MALDFQGLHPAEGADTYDDLLAEIDQLRQALETRDRIGQAKGVVRLLAHCDSESAFLLLSKLSQDTNRRLTEVADVIVDCSCTGRPLPRDLARSWRGRLAQPS